MLTNLAASHFYVGQSWTAGGIRTNEKAHLGDRAHVGRQNRFHQFRLMYMANYSMVKHAAFISMAALFPSVPSLSI